MKLSKERPSVLFDLATGLADRTQSTAADVSILERLITSTRERAQERLWRALA